MQNMDALLDIFPVQNKLTIEVTKSNLSLNEKLYPKYLVRNKSGGLLTLDNMDSFLVFPEKKEKSKKEESTNTFSPTPILYNHLYADSLNFLRIQYYTSYHIKRNSQSILPAVKSLCFLTKSKGLLPISVYRPLKSKYLGYCSGILTTIRKRSYKLLFVNTVSLMNKAQRKFSTAMMFSGLHFSEKLLRLKIYGCLPSLTLELEEKKKKFHKRQFFKRQAKRTDSFGQKHLPKRKHSSKRKFSLRTFFVSPKVFVKKNTLFNSVPVNGIDKLEIIKVKKKESLKKKRKVPSGTK
jgi:hypothetical protein